MKAKVIFSSLLACILLASCAKTYDAPKAKLNRADFQTEIDGKANDLYILKNANGIEITMMNYGARIVSIATPDKNGKFADIVLGFDHIQPYLDNEKHVTAFHHFFSLQSPKISQRNVNPYEFLFILPG